MMRSYILILTLLFLCLLFITRNQVLGQTKEPKNFDLNKTPPPEDGPEGEIVHSQYPIDNTSMITDKVNEAEVNQDKKNRKRKAKVEPNEKAERKRAYNREKSKKRRQGLRERKLAGTLTESDLKTLDSMRSHYQNYYRDHKETLSQRHKDYRKNHLAEFAARSRKWRSENLEKARQSDRRYRENNAEKIKIDKARLRLKQQNVETNDRSTEKQSSL
ncbi:uncharacterized protein FA14DRAFT_157054 [Meira miltonrushii]|uniref:BZIP domain-containing protein n=1 Tax=Meira miltonrushii TaxID=1280837 RepID=A0A316VA91_9BASI|nr:uncharacterized protein FA14DRAFT_157054 [Meira miltonrushii]PWN34390.1 hypothetical protein FA14DRAFT_157054 [Meira miltonrushii]